MHEPLVILSRDGGHDPERTPLEEAVAQRFTAAGIPVLLIPPFYHLAEDHPLWARIADRIQPRTAILSWIHPRPAEWIARRHGWCTDTRAPSFFNLSAFPDADTCFAQVRSGLPPSEEGAGAVDVEDWTTLTGERWYPVLDYSRCTDCRQCLQFCLFGVYTLDEEGKVRASAPDQCKPGCPACSRICPSSAIMFPLCEVDEAIAGAPGRLVEPDSAMKSVYYERTGKPCPLCGRSYRTAWKRAHPDVPSCPECGMVEESAGPGTDPEPDDLDGLIDALEKLR